MKPAISKVLSHIAAKRLYIPTLETRGSDSLDFHDLSVWSIHDALHQAFSAGKVAAETNAPLIEQLVTALQVARNFYGDGLDPDDPAEASVMAIIDAAIAAGRQP